MYKIKGIMIDDIVWVRVPGTSGNGVLKTLVKEIIINRSGVSFRLDNLLELFRESQLSHLPLHPIEK